VAGTIDGSTAKTFSGFLEDYVEANSSRLNRDPLIVDAREVNHIDSEGIRSLVRLKNQLGDINPESKLRLVCKKGAVIARVITLARLDELFGVYQSLPEALGG
jgi:anti-anti-sigma factor